ncbi:MAG TPA: hypothetical protein VFZ12_05970 [Dehalococcoidia bacterium]|nr:hypothetical protein [Dehalococcoidia bacterium]
MQQTNMEPGVYIDAQSNKILRVAEGNETEGREGHWERLTEDPNMGLLGAREAAVEKGYVDDGKEVDWYRYEEGEMEDLETLEELNKAQAKADAEAEAERERTSQPMAY